VCYGDHVLLIDTTSGFVLNTENTKTVTSGYIALRDKSVLGEAHAVFLRAAAPTAVGTPVSLSDAASGGRILVRLIPARAGLSADAARAGKPLTVAKKSSSMTVGGYLLSDGSGAEVTFDIGLATDPALGAHQPHGQQRTPLQLGLDAADAGGTPGGVFATPARAQASGGAPRSPSFAGGSLPNSPSSLGGPQQQLGAAGLGSPQPAGAAVNASLCAAAALAASRSPLLTPLRYGDRVRLHASSVYYAGAAVTVPDRLGVVGLYLKHSLVAMGPMVPGADAGMFVPSEFTVLPAPAAAAGAAGALGGVVGDVVRYSSAVALVDAQGCVWNNKLTGTWGEGYLSPHVNPAASAAGPYADPAALANAMTVDSLSAGEVHLSFQPLAPQLQGTPVLAAPAGSLPRVLAAAATTPDRAATIAAAGGCAIDIEYCHRKSAKFNTRLRAYKRPTSQLVGGYIVCVPDTGKPLNFVIEKVSEQPPAPAAAAAATAPTAVAAQATPSSHSHSQTPARGSRQRTPAQAPAEEEEPVEGEGDEEEAEEAGAPAEPMPFIALPASTRTAAAAAVARVSAASLLALAAVALAALAAVSAQASHVPLLPTAAALPALADGAAAWAAFFVAHKPAVYGTLAAALAAAATLAGRPAARRHRATTGAGALMAQSREGAVRWRAQQAIRADARRTQKEARASARRAAASAKAKNQHARAQAAVGGTGEQAGPVNTADGDGSSISAGASAEEGGADEATGGQGGDLDIDDPSQSVAVPYSAAQFPDTPVRYVNAEKGNQEKGRARFLKTMQWRSVNGLDRMLFREHPMFRFVKRHTHQFFAGQAKAGHFVYYERPKGANLPAFAKAGVTIDELLYHFVYITEFLYQRLDSNPDAKCVSVVDCSGIGLSDFGGAVVDFVKKISSVTQTHYPERSAGIICINAPFSFRMVWAVVKKLMDPVTRSKTHILGSSFLKDMEKVIDKSQIPAEYGGTRPYAPTIEPRGPALPETALEPRFDVDVLPLSPEEETLFKLADSYNAEAARRWPNRKLVRGLLAGVEEATEQP
jgi:hypothetical protein